MRRLLAPVLVCAALLAFAPAALAKTYHPNKHGDHTPNGCSHSDCTLREAVIGANHHSGFDTIILRGGDTYKLSRAVTADDEKDGDLDLFDTGGAGVTVKSSNHRLATVDAQRIDGVFESSYTANFRYLRIRHGKDPFGGGGIDTAGRTKVAHSLIAGNSASSGGGIQSSSKKLTVSKSIIRSNRSVITGGGIQANSGGLLVFKTTITGNRSTSGFGGGIENGDAATISRSTIDHNVALASGGGISNLGSTLSIVNSTIGNNRTNESGGGIAQFAGSTKLNAVTVARNTADADNDSNGTGGGVYADIASFSLQNTLVALNSTNGNPDSDCHKTGAVTFTSGGHNLVRRAGNCTWASSDYVDSEVTRLGLGLLKFRGGPTKTMSISQRSTARNHANSHAPSRDQRGHKRHNPDIGAFEY